MNIRITVKVNIPTILKAQRAAQIEGLWARAASEAAEKKARRLSPVDSGYLRASVSSGVVGSEGYIDASAPHAPYVVHGTYKMAARPFLQEAADETNVLKIAQRVLRRFLGG